MKVPRAAKPAALPGPPRRSPTNSARLGSVRVLALLAVLVGAGALGLTLGLRGLASDESPVSASARALAQRAGPLIVFSEFGESADTLWAADPDDPAHRIKLARIEHAPGYGVSPRLSPDGTHIAYTLLPPDVPPGPGGTAELWVLNTESGVSSRLAEGVDLVVGPIWSPSGDSVAVRRSERIEGGSGGARLLRIDLTGTAATVASADAGLFPIDFSPDDAWFYYAVQSSDGTDLARAPAAGGGQSETVAHLSDGFARDWHLSPDGTRLAYLAQDPEQAGVTFAAQVLDISAGGARTVLGSAAVAHFNPIWERSGNLTIGRLDGAGAGGAPARFSVDGDPVPVASRLAGPAQGAGFDVPISWSPDGRHLAVRSFEGASVSDPGPSRVVVVGTGGERHELSPRSDVVVAGWLHASQ